MYMKLESIIQPLTLKSSSIVTSCSDNSDLEISLALVSTSKTHERSNIGRWNYDEQVLYLAFVQSHKALLESKDSRRSTKVFKLMATLIDTRQPDQCRSHHQKMQKKYETVENILHCCRKNLPRLKKKSNMIELRVTTKAPTTQIPEVATTVSALEVKVEEESPAEFSPEGNFTLNVERDPSQINFLMCKQESNLFNLDEDSYQMLF